MTSKALRDSTLSDNSLDTFPYRGNVSDLTS